MREMWNKMVQENIRNAFMPKTQNRRLRTFKMVTKEEVHNRIRSLLYELVNEDKSTYSEVRKPGTEIIELKQHLPEIGKFQPDVHALKKRTGRLDVYEVWCGETREKAYFDILRSLIVPQVDWIHIVTIYKNGWEWEKSDVKDVQKVLKELLRGFYRKKLEKKLAICEITEEELNNDDKYFQKKLAKRFDLQQV